MLNWKQLIVTDNEGGTAGTLEEIVTLCPANLDSAEIETDGSLGAWPDYLLSAPGEEPEWDTPREDVDWTGFADALGR